MRVRHITCSLALSVALPMAAAIVSCGFYDKIGETLNPEKPNTHPIAIVADPEKTVQVNSTVLLDGTRSFDPQQEILTFAWTMDERPNGSAAALSSATTSITTFVADKGGYYTITLVITNASGQQSQTAFARVSVVGTGDNHPPVAIAGADQTVTIGTLAFLDGSDSFDVDGDTLTFSWLLVGAPLTSSATTSAPDALNFLLVPDIAGTYTVQLWVSDGIDSDFDTVTVTAQ